MVARGITHRLEPLAASRPESQANFAKCCVIAGRVQFPALELRRSALISGHAAHETFMQPLRRSRADAGRPTAAAQRSSRADLDLPPHPVAARRIQLPPLADLLGLWRRGDRTIRAVGWRLDDTGAAAALSAIWHVRSRSRTECGSARRALVSALALRPLARRQRCAVELRFDWIRTETPGSCLDAFSSREFFPRTGVHFARERSEKTQRQQFLAAALSIEMRIPDPRNRKRDAGIVPSTRWEETTMRWKISPP